MERNDYLDLCRKVSRIQEGILHMRDVPENLQVEYDGDRYYPVTFFYRFVCGFPMNCVVLHCLKANSTITAELKDISAVCEDKSEPEQN